MKKRIFVAITISPKLQEEIIKWEKQYEKLPIRWLACKNLHITLVPPWYEENIDMIKEKLETIRGTFGSFEIQFERVTYGPNPRRPRLIWAEGPPPQALLDLRANISQLLDARSEVRVFRLHLTLARFRSETFSSFPIKKLDEKVSWHDKINSFVLMESHLSPEGADYEILAEFPFGA